MKGDEGDGKPGEEARFNGMHSLAVGPDGNVYLADTWNNRVRVFDSKAGIVRAFAGTGEKGFSGDGGPADKARFGGCFCVAFDPPGKSLFITDLDNRRIRKVDMATKIVTTVAGNGQKGVPKDGEPAAKQPLVDPRAACADRRREPVDSGARRSCPQGRGREGHDPDRRRDGHKRDGHRSRRLKRR